MGVHLIVGNTKANLSPLAYCNQAPYQIRFSSIKYVPVLGCNSHTNAKFISKAQVTESNVK